MTDPNIPMWVIKTGGETYYVHHVEANAKWNTKETPDNPHTKGSLKFKNVDIVINDDSCAEIIQKE